MCYWLMDATDEADSPSLHISMWKQNGHRHALPHIKVSPAARYGELLFDGAQRVNANQVDTDNRCPSFGNIFKRLFEN